MRSLCLNAFEPPLERVPASGRVVTISVLAVMGLS